MSKWLLAIYMMCASKNGVAAYELHRTLGVTNKTAWFMNHRIREAMKRGPLADAFRGVVVADETYIGGKAANKHRQSKGRNYGGAGSKSGPRYDKVPVLSLVNKATGEVRSQAVADVTGDTLRKVMAEHVDIAGSVLHTDKGPHYRTLGREFVEHHSVDHSTAEYVRGDVSTNQAENFFSQLKRSIDGTHHRVSAEHLSRYLAEFDYRYSTRKMNDTERMVKLMDRVGGKRLTYKRVTG